MYSHIVKQNGQTLSVVCLIPWNVVTSQLMFKLLSGYSGNNGKCAVCNTLQLSKM